MSGAATGAPAPGPGALFDYRYESRPDTRNKHALWAEIRRAIREITGETCDTPRELEKLMADRDVKRKIRVSGRRP